MPLRLLTKIWAPLLALPFLCHTDAAVSKGPSPIGRVTKMLDGMILKIQSQGKAEQASYDKFSKWCGETAKETAAEIEKGKRTIDDLGNSIVKYSGDLGSLGAEIDQLTKDVAANKEEQKEAETLRSNEHASFEDERREAEQAIGALNTAIKVLAGGAGKFLQSGARALGSYQEAQLMSVAADVRGVLGKPAASRYMSEQDLKAIRAFVSNPSGGMSAMQTSQGQNPFGDYAPQSDQIQGILTGLHDSFVSDLAKSKAKEEGDQKSFEELMAVKAADLKTLSDRLSLSEANFAQKKKTKADMKEELDRTKDDLKADEALFQETEATCKEKAAEWSKRSELRDMELKGIQEANKILTSKEAAKAFKGAASLVQLSQTRHHAVRLYSRSGVSVALRHRAYAQLQKLASKYESVSAAQIAVQVQSGGAFDKVIMMIDQMLADLRSEEQEDIDHRDRCQNSQNANSNEKEDLEHATGVVKEKIARLEDSQKAKQKSHDTHEDERKEIEQEMDTRLDLRNKEHAEFLRALEADADAVKIIGLAQDALSKFYKKQGQAAKLLQTDASIGSAEAPKVSWGDEGGSYGGLQGMNKGAIGALEHIKEDLEKEIRTGKAEDDERQKQYEQDAAALEKALKTKKDTISTIKKQLAELGVRLEDHEAALSQNQEDSKEAEEMKKALETDCKWVESHFDKRVKQRRDEMSGLQEAKDHLAKASDGDEEADLDFD